MEYDPKELDKRLIQAISEFEGVPTPGGLRGVTGGGINTIGKRIGANPRMAEMMVERGEKWLRGLKEKDFLKKMSTHGWRGNLPKYAADKADARFMGIVLREIERFEGVPTGNTLADALGVSGPALNRFIKKNPNVKERVEGRGREWLDGLSDEELLKGYSGGTWKKGLPEYAREMVKERVKGIIRGTIQRFDGIPTVKALSRLFGVSETTILEYIKDCPIAQEMKERGDKWLDGLSDEELIKAYSKSGWASDSVKEKIQKRVDGILLKAIHGYEGKPNASILERILGISLSAVIRRINANETIWLTYHAKRGLTPDQAVELALERGENSEGFRKALNERLRNLSAMREMIGVIRCFSDLMQKAVACISLYPDPLTKAAEEIGDKMESAYVDMAPLRKGKAAGIPECGTLLVHGLHRLPEEGINALFTEIRSLYAEHPELSIIATHSTRYVASEGFIESLVRCGFSLENSGMILMGAPDEETLESYGVPKEDLWRVRRKVSGEFGVMELKVEAECGAARIPCLEKAPSGNGDSSILPEAEAIDVPTGVGKELIARFLPDAVVVSPEPFMVEIMDGGKPCALVGFDMDPGKKNVVEVIPYPDSPSENYRGIARRLATQLGLRRKLGVKSNSIKRVQLSACRDRRG